MGKPSFGFIVKSFRADPEMTSVPIAPSDFAPDEGNLTTWRMVRKTDKGSHEICKQAVRWSFRDMLLNPGKTAFQMSQRIAL